MTRRPGMTMTEVLVAIFVVAIGLAGVMSMVPFGAKQMSDALVADRATSHSITIDGMMRSYWKEKIVENPGNTEPFWIALENPGNGLTLPLATEPSYPVFIDPIGTPRPDPADKWVGDTGNTSIPRRTMNSFTNPDQAIGPWSQADGFSWDEDSRPLSGASMREYRYNALAVIQRPTQSDKTTATLKIVVFNNRRPRFFPPGSEVVFNGVAFTPNLTTLQLPTSSGVQKGNWIMDATIQSAPNPVLRHANFYRVVSAVENTAGTLDLELHTPIKRSDSASGTYTGSVVVMPGIAGVFERPPLSAGNP